MFWIKEQTPESISRQLLMGLSIKICSLFFISTFIAYNMAAWFANEASDRELLNATHAVAARLNDDESGLVAELPKAVQAVLRHDENDRFFYQVLNEKCERLSGDAILPMPTGDLQTDEPRFKYGKVDNVEVRMVRIRVPLNFDEERIVIVQTARTMNARRTLLGQIFFSIVIPQLILGIFSIYAVGSGVKTGLKPLRKLSEEIRQRSQSDLTPIGSEKAPAEIIPIITALNTLFLRLETFVDGQQRFVANAAHQLRTPVAGLRAYIEYGRRVATNNARFNEVLDHFETGTDRMSNLVAGLLILARTCESRQEEHQELVSLNVLASDVCSMFARAAAEKKISLEYVTSSEAAVTLGNRAELQEMLSNIVDNAIRYTQRDGFVKLLVEAGPPAKIEVVDNGPGIPTEERNRVFERFYRVLGSKVNGSGLGLAIVSEIASANKATVELLDPPEHRGTLASVTFKHLQ